MTLAFNKYAKNYRQAFGFDTQGKTKEFLAAKDFSAAIDFDYLDSLNNRVVEIIEKINTVVHKKIKVLDLKSFISERIIPAFERIKGLGILHKLNNLGRRPEEVCFSWMRGYAVQEYFVPCIAKIFNVLPKTVSRSGEDKLDSVEAFRKSPKADLEITVSSKIKWKLEIQSGFQGINDIKEHKIREAKRVWLANKKPTICIHFDIYNGQVAFVPIHEITDSDVNWVTRQQMEGQTVFSIDQNFFQWRLMDPLPRFNEMDLK